MPFARNPLLLVEFLHQVPHAICTEKHIMPSRFSAMGCSPTTGNRGGVRGGQCALLEGCSSVGGGWRCPRLRAERRRPWTGARKNGRDNAGAWRRNGERWGVPWRRLYRWGRQRRVRQEGVMAGASSAHWWAWAAACQSWFSL